MSTAGQVAVDLAELADDVADRGYALVVHHTAMLQTRVKRHANVDRSAVRPRAEGDVQGPRFLEGNYNRSINRRVTRLPGAAIGEVGTNAPQGRRLELGFDGVDSLGREYHQLPYPHFGPALEETIPHFVADLALAGLPTFRTGR
jgi:hypothetical protein